MDRHVRVNFGRCAINMVAVTHKLPLLGDISPPSLRGNAVPVGGQFESLYCSYGPPYLFKFWSIWDKYNGRQTQISHFQAFSRLLTPLPPEFLENIV